jgi:hypothetical protein
MTWYDHYLKKKKKKKKKKKAFPIVLDLNYVYKIIEYQRSGNTRPTINEKSHILVDTIPKA